jgi:hypothetical protein
MTKLVPMVLCPFLLVAPSAHAETETVHLSDGSVFAGELVEKVPGDHVTIKLASSGEVRRFAWSAIASQPLAVAVGQPQVIVPQLPPLPPRSGTVRFVSNNKGTLLMRVDSIPAFTVNGWGQTRQSPVCYAPCTAVIDANATYYVEGYNISASTHFAIPEGSSTVSVRTGAEALTVTGVTLASLGSMSLITGAIATPIAFADSKSPGINGWEAFGLSALIGGAAFILIAVPFILAGRTRVTLGDMDVALGKHLRLSF